MIIIHQDNVAAFVGAHTYYWIPQPLFLQRISLTSAAVVEPEPDLVAPTGGWLHQREREWLRRLGQPPEIVAQVRQLVPEVEAIFETDEQLVSVSRVTREATEAAEESTFLDTLEALATDLEAEHQRLAQDLRNVVTRLRDDEMQAVFLMTVMLLV